MRTLLYFLMLPLSTIWNGSVCLVARLFGVRRVAGGVYDRAQRHWGRWILAASGVEVTVRGGEHMPRGEPIMITANHASFFDILALIGHLPVDPKFVAKKELFSIPLLGPAMKAAGHIPIERAKLKEAFAAYEIAGKRIRDEKLPVLVYPEGTRSATGEMQPFKKGPFVLGIATQAPVVPVYVEGAFGIQPKGSRRVRPHPIRIYIGEPIPTAGMTFDDRDALTAKVQAAVRALQVTAIAAAPSR